MRLFFFSAMSSPSPSFFTPFGPPPAQITPNWGYMTTISRLPFQQYSTLSSHLQHGLRPPSLSGGAGLEFVAHISWYRPSSWLQPLVQTNFFPSSFPLECLHVLTQRLPMQRLPGGPSVGSRSLLAEKQAHSAFGTRQSANLWQPVSFLELTSAQPPASSLPALQHQVLG